MKLRKASEIRLNPDNPRLIKDDKFKKLVKSLKEFPAMAKVRPIILDDSDVILGGNMRFRAMQEAGWKKFPTDVFTRAMSDQMNIEAKERGEEEKTYEQHCEEFVIKDNVNFGEWDYSELANLWDEHALQDWGLDLNFSEPKEGEEPYTKKIQTPVYQVKGEKPEISQMIDTERTQQLITDINNADVPDDIKDFLIHAAGRHTVFNYENIAEYYAHAPKEIQLLFEDSALVIIDFNKAIENGLVNLSDKIKNQYTEDYGDEE